MSNKTGKRYVLVPADLYYAQERGLRFDKPPEEKRIMLSEQQLMQEIVEADATVQETTLDATNKTTLLISSIA